MFTAPTFVTFALLVTGALSTVGPRTVTGMWSAAGMAARVHWSRTHRFFSHVRWDLDVLGLALARIVVACFTVDGEALTVAVDDSLFHRYGRRLFGVFWQHDGSAKGRDGIGRGNCFVIAGLVVATPWERRHGAGRAVDEPGRRACPAVSQRLSAPPRCEHLARERMLRPWQTLKCGLASVPQQGSLQHRPGLPCLPRRPTVVRAQPLGGPVFPRAGVTGDTGWVHFELLVRIHRTPAEVFAFLRDKDRYPQKPGSPVLALELLTPEPPGRGSRYREVVRMLPWYTGQITSVVTRFDPPHGLAEDFVGPGMRGHLEYEIAADPAGTLLVQRERLHPQGALRLVTPVIRATLARRLRSRLDGIKAELDAGWVVDLNRENRRGHR